MDHIIWKLKFSLLIHLVYCYLSDEFAENRTYPVLELQTHFSGIFSQVLLFISILEHVELY